MLISGWNDTPDVNNSGTVWETNKLTPGIGLSDATSGIVHGQYDNMYLSNGTSGAWTGGFTPPRLVRVGQHVEIEGYRPPAWASPGTCSGQGGRQRSVLSLLVKRGSFFQLTLASPS